MSSYISFKLEGDRKLNSCSPLSPPPASFATQGWASMALLLGARVELDHRLKQFVVYIKNGSSVLKTFSRILPTEVPSF